MDFCIWVRSLNCGCLVTWFCYQLIANWITRQPQFRDLTHIFMTLLVIFFLPLSCSPLQVWCAVVQPRWKPSREGRCTWDTMPPSSSRKSMVTRCTGWYVSDKSLISLWHRWVPLGGIISADMIYNQTFLPEASFGLRVLSLPASVCVCVRMCASTPCLSAR